MVEVENEVAPATAAPPPPRPILSPSAIPGTEFGWLDRGAAARAIVKAGLLGVFIGIIPFLGFLITGVLAVWFYRRAGGGALTAGIGSRIGGTAGGLATAISGLYTVVQIFIFHAAKTSEEGLTKVLTMFGVDPADPRTQAMIHDLFTPSGIVLSLVFGLILSVALAAIGGALAAAMFRSR